MSYTLNATLNEGQFCENQQFNVEIGHIIKLYPGPSLLHKNVVLYTNYPPSKSRYCRDTYWKLQWKSNDGTLIPFRSNGTTNVSSLDIVYEFVAGRIGNFKFQFSNEENGAEKGSLYVRIEPNSEAGTSGETINCGQKRVAPYEVTEPPAKLARTQSITESIIGPLETIDLTDVPVARSVSMETFDLTNVPPPPSHLHVRPAYIDFIYQLAPESYFTYNRNARNQQSDAQQHGQNYAEQRKTASQRSGQRKETQIHERRNYLPDWIPWPTIPPTFQQPISVPQPPVIRPPRFSQPTAPVQRSSVNHPTRFPRPMSSPEPAIACQSNFPQPMSSPELEIACSSDFPQPIPFQNPSCSCVSDEHECERDVYDEPLQDEPIFERSNNVHRVLGETIVFDPPNTQPPHESDSFEQLLRKYDDSNRTIKIRLLWDCVEEEHLHPYLQSFDELFRTLAIREKCSSSLIVLLLDDRVIKRDDSPASINYNVTKVITGRIVYDLEPPSTLRNRDIIKLKLQALKLKRAVSIKINKTHPFSSILSKCASILGTEPNRIKLMFDGEFIDLDATPISLDLSGGEILDCVVKK